MSLQTPILCWAGIGALCVAGLLASPKALNSAPEAVAIPFRPMVLPGQAPTIGFSHLPATFTLQEAEMRLAEKSRPLPQSQKGSGNPTAPVKRSQKLPPPLAAGDAPIVRVRVANDPNQIAIATSNQGAIALPNGETVGGVKPAQPHAVTIGPNGLLIGNQAYPNGILVFPGTQGLTWINGQWYRGKVRLIWDGRQLNAINEVELDRYLYGVVGAEMPPDWHWEALKAQAIAARSYALALMEQPANAYWDLGNDEAFQCYRGVETETNTTVAAVEATRGTILVKNNSIFLSQYAATDEISQVAHGGIGKSMSQTGAQQLANQGATVFQILNHYYPEAGLGMLQPKK